MPFIAAFAAAAATAVGSAVATAVGGAIGVFGAVTGLNVIGAQFAAASFISSLAGASGLGAFVSSWSTVSLLASSALSPPQVGLGAAGTQVDFQADTNAGVPLVIGRTGTAGKIVHVMTTGAAHKNGHLAYKVVLSAGPIEGVESFSANGVPVAFAGDTAQTGKYLNQMWMRDDLGTKPQAANVPGGYDPAWTPEWTAAHKLSGLASAWWTMYFSPEAYPTGTPPPMWVVLGPAVYDPRKDSTYPGGVGPQRADDETTWSFAGRDNPYLQALTWCLGRRANGKLVHGAGVPLASIDVAAFVNGANIAEANGWTVGGEITSSDRKWEVLRAMLQAGGGVPAFTGGRLTCVVRAPRVSLRTVTGADIVGPARITGGRPRRERFNRIVPQYRSEAHAWEMVAAGAVEVAEYIAADGGERRSREVVYPLVQDAEQVAQLAAYDIVDARELEPIVLPLKPLYAGYRSGDCLTVNEPEIGLVGQLVVIVGREIDLASGIVTLTCVSETPGKHDFALGRTGSPPPTPGLVGIDPTDLAEPGALAFTVLGETIVSEGQSIPAVVVTGASDNPNAVELLVQYRMVGSAEWVSWPAVHLPAEGLDVRVEVTAVTAQTDYEVRIAYRSGRGTTSPWRNEGTATAGEFNLEGLGQAISDGALTPGEKLFVVPQIYGVIDARPSLRQSADAVGALESNNLDRLAYETAADDLDSVLASWTTPVAWHDSSATTDVPNPAAFIAAFRASLTSERDLQNQITALWANRIEDIDASVIDMADDAVLTPAEKMLIIPQVNALRASRAQIRARANELNLTTANNLERQAFENAATAFDATLAAITTPVAWNNYTDKSTLPDPAAFRNQFEACISTQTNLQAQIDYIVNSKTNAVQSQANGLTVTTNQLQTTTNGLQTTTSQLNTRTGTVEYKTAYLGTDGRMYSLNGMPINAGIGASAYRTVYPFIAYEAAVQINPHTEYRTGGNINHPVGSIFGLSAGTTYDFFWSYPHGGYIPVSLAFSQNYMVEGYNYIWIGRQTTRTAGGGTPPSPPAAPPGAGGGGPRSPYEVIP